MHWCHVDNVIVKLLVIAYSHNHMHSSPFHLDCGGEEGRGEQGPATANWSTTGNKIISAWVIVNALMAMEKVTGCNAGHHF